MWIVFKNYFHTSCGAIWSKIWSYISEDVKKCACTFEIPITFFIEESREELCLTFRSDNGYEKITTFGPNSATHSRDDMPFHSDDSESDERITTFGPDAAPANREENENSIDVDMLLYSDGGAHLSELMSSEFDFSESEVSCVSKKNAVFVRFWQENVFFHKQKII